MNMKPWKRACFSPSPSKRGAAAGALCLLACAGTIPEPGEGHRLWAESHGHAATLEGLREGRRLLVQKCDGCHFLPKPRRYAPEDWPFWMDSMQVEFRKEGILGVTT